MQNEGEEFKSECSIEDAKPMPDKKSNAKAGGKGRAD